MERAERRPSPKTVFTPRPLDPAIAEQVRQLRQPPNSEELARRTMVLAKLNKLWDELPPLDTDPSEFLRQSREEDEASVDG